MAPSGTVTRGKGKASSTAASRPASRSGSPPADDANTTIVPGTITLAQFRDPGDLPSQIPGFPSTSYLGQTASSNASIIDGISSSTQFEHANNPALSHEPTPAYRSYTHYRTAPSAVPPDTGRCSPAASADHLGATDNFNAQSLLVLSYIDRIFDRLVPFCQAWTPAMSRCGDVGQLDEWTIGRRTRCLRGRKVMAPCREGRERESSLSGRARDRKQKY